MLKPNYAAVRALVTDAQPVAAVSRRFTGDPEPGSPRGETMPGQWAPDALGLPPDCPVVPLGVDGSISWFIDPIGQLYQYVKPYGQADTLELFRGRHLYLYWAWPKFRGQTSDGSPDVDGWKNEKARETLIAAATAKGPWSSVEKVRGRGAWLADNGGLILHTGDQLIVNGQKKPPGEYGGHVYPTRPQVPRPWPQPVEPAQNPAKLLRPLLRSWAWSRPDIDPQLLLGWIGAAFLGAALPWRPTVFINGDKAAGKSTLQELIKRLLGDALIQAADTSGAGIYQRVGQDCLPVAVDELEGEADVRKQKAVLKLARLAASGGLMLRGGDRHVGVEFQARSCFLFSSINTPPLEPQDLSRMALLRLHRLPQGQQSPDLDPQTFAVIGRCILRRVIDQWPRFRETWAAFRQELGRGGHDGRGQDTFGTLLTIADMIEYDGWDDTRLRYPSDGDMVPWSVLMAATGMHEYEDASENWRLCLNHLLSVQVEAWRNVDKRTVGQILEAFHGGGSDDEKDIVKVRQKLGHAGLGLQRLIVAGNSIEERQEDWLVIPNQNPRTRTLFENTKWGGEIGSGVWQGALRQAPQETIYTTGQCKVNGVKSRCTLIRLAGLYGHDGIMSASDA
jgi:hypothetical protein